MKALSKAGHRGQEIELRGAIGGDFMICLSYDGGQATICQNGRHLGIRVGEAVFDNLHPQGLAFDRWLQDFDALGGVVIYRIEEF